MDHDDLLTADALYEVVKALNQKERPAVLYSDEDKVTTDLSEHFQPFMKPDFNKDLLRSNNYICHSLWRKCSWWKKWAVSGELLTEPRIMT